MFLLVKKIGLRIFPFLTFCVCFVNLLDLTLKKLLKLREIAACIHLPAQTTQVSPLEIQSGIDRTSRG